MTIVLPFVLFFVTGAVMFAWGFRAGRFYERTETQARLHAARLQVHALLSIVHRAQDTEGHTPENARRN